MKFKKAMIMCLLTLVVLFTMSGCVGASYHVEVNRNGGSVTSYYLIPEEFLESQEDTDSATDPTLDVEAILDAPILEIDGIRFLKIEANTETTDSLEALSQRLNTISLEETSYFALEKNAEEESVQQEPAESGDSLTRPLRDVRIAVDPEKNDIVITGFIIPTNNLFFEMEFVFPGQITEHTLGETINDTTLRIRTHEFWEEEADIPFTIRADLPNTGFRMAVTAVVMAMMLLGGLFLWKKRPISPRTQQEHVDAPVQQEETSEPS